VRACVRACMCVGMVVLTAPGGEHTARAGSITAKSPTRDRSGCESRVLSLSFYKVYPPFFAKSIGILITGDNPVLKFCRVLYEATRE